MFGRGQPAKEPLHRQLSPCFFLWVCVCVFCLQNSPQKGQGIFFFDISCIISFVTLLKSCQQPKHSFKRSGHFLPSVFHHKTTLKGALARKQKSSHSGLNAQYVAGSIYQAFEEFLRFLLADWIFTLCGSNLSLPHYTVIKHYVSTHSIAGDALALQWLSVGITMTSVPLRPVTPSNEF